jgi:uncharacterized protein (DUF427 family)
MEIGHQEPCPRRVRAVHGGVVGVDTTEALYVWDVPYYPAWYVPSASINWEVIPPSAISDGQGIDGYSRIDWNGVDAWFEEDEEVFKHPRDPYHRVDALHASRHVRVFVDGQLVADSTSPRLLFETRLPVRYYLPKLDVRMDLLTATDTSSVCPYKGTAEYWSVDVNGAHHKDLVWGYRDPIPEAAKIAGLVCFYNEKVDIEVDGEMLSRPKTQFA